MSQPRLRKPRFARSPDSPRLCITERDVRILASVERHRFIRSDQLRAVVGGSAQHLTRRIGRLYHAGFLERPRAQLILQQRSNAHFIYHITERGQYVLRERGLPTFASPPRSRGETMALSLSHAVRVTDVMLALEHSAIASDAKFLPHGEWSGSEDPMRLSLMKWGVNLNYDGKRVRSVMFPDGAFALDYAGKRYYYFVEVDRGTMPVSRSSAEQTSFRRKAIAYKATRDAGILWRRCEIPAFRVLVVAESKCRLMALQAATAGLFKNGITQLFCFAQASTLLRGSPGVWQSCGAASVEIIPVCKSRPPV